MALEQGQAAPPFTLPDQQGNPVSLADFRGRDVIVYFYPRDETPGCTKEACAFRDLWARFRSLDVAVLGVSPDDAAAHRRFIARHELPFPLLSDSDRRVMTRYGAWGEKTLYGRKSMGVIRSTVWIDARGKVKRHWKRVSRAAEHPAAVLAALASRDAAVDP
jgi:peroxiredoxin Q/BCP